MLDQAQNKKHLATAKQLIRKNFAYCFKIRQFSSQSKGKDRLDPPPRDRFSSLFKDVLNDPFDSSKIPLKILKLNEYTYEV